ncbi:ATP-dependent helicase [Halobacillus salinus]|uniref:DNA 3'-5' helicase n=1 Tax=Halobacillus salinus TaxID=192814 RepID=A0A4Z0GZZ0_9BACI|nr:ATP-dependent helicase [Halobacillus salinus]TGB03782.1 ATP-dependent helicase [Halobacillus salinus]
MSEQFFNKMEQVTGVKLNDVQKQAVTHTDGPLLLLASPGSGKTTTLNMKIGYLLLEEQVPADQIMAVTFSKAAANDMSERFDQFFSTVTNEKVHFSTIHSFAYQVVRESLRGSGMPYQLIEGSISDEELKKGWDGPNVPLHKKFILKKLYWDTNGKQISEEDMDELMTYISLVKNRMVQHKDLDSIECNVSQAGTIYQAYERFKQNHEPVLLDFDDMLTYCHKILDEDAGMLAKYQRQFEYLLTDESQDNSLVQHEIVELLAGPQANICVVADDDQSIFAWRGSDVTKLLQFEKSYPGATVLTMSQNYRSTPEIVDASNQFIKRNEKRYPKDMFTHNDSAEAIEIKSTRTYDEQLQRVMNAIQASGDEDIAVLYRNNTSAVPLADKLEKAGIDFYMKDIDPKFFKHWVVEDILNFMRLSYNDKRVDILERIHTKCNAYISKAQIAFLKKKNSEKSVFDRLLDSDIPSYQEKTLPRVKKTIRDMNDMAPDRAIRTIREKLGYDVSIKKMAEKFGFNQDQLFSTLSILENIAEGLGTLKEFADRLKKLEQIIQTSKFNKSTSRLTLSTFHSAKGLEYDRVFMIDLVNGVIPSDDDMERFRNKDTAPMEEAVRLFYVGMTRARTNLELLTYQYKADERLTESIFVTNMRRILKPAASGALTGEGLSADDIELGKEIVHRKFGPGVITEYGGDSMGIQFEEAGFKELLVDVCIDNGLLQKA